MELTSFFKRRLISEMVMKLNCNQKLCFIIVLKTNIYVMSLFLLFNSINYGYTFKVRSHFEKDIFNDDLKLHF